MANETYGKSFALGTSSAELDTDLGPNETLQITTAKAIDSSGSARLVHINLASDGAAASTANLVENGSSVPANGSYGTNLVGMNIVPGAKLYAYADLAGVTLQLHGLLTDQAPR